jgi:hypothetical protein
MHWYNNVYGFLNHNVVLRHNKYIKSTIHDHQYEYQTDWISGEVPWEFIDLDNHINIQDTFTPVIHITTSPATIINDDNNLHNSNGRYVNGYTNSNTDFDNVMMTKAIVSGVMKGIYVQIVSIDNIITYTQCYTNKVIDMDIVLSLLYYILYEKNKNNEIENIIILKKYNNIELFEKYIKLRRNSMFMIIIMYVLLFRGISNVE